MEILFKPFHWLIVVPPLGLIPVALLGLCFLHKRSRLTRFGSAWVLVGMASWLAYTVYECAVWVWSQGVSNPIRVDLLLIAPALYVLSILGGLACWKARRKA